MNKCLIVMTAALLSGGCFFSSGTTLKVSHYQAGLKGDVKAFSRLRVGVVSNISGAGKEFLVRLGGSQVKTLSGKRWLNSPEVMLKSAMLMNFDGGSDAETVSAQILRFEFDPGLENLEAVIVFTLRTGESIVCMEKVDVKDENYGDAAAAIFENAVLKVVNKVKK